MVCGHFLSLPNSKTHWGLRAKCRYFGSTLTKFWFYKVIFIKSPVQNFTEIRSDTKTSWNIRTDRHIWWSQQPSLNNIRTHQNDLHATNHMFTLIPLSDMTEVQTFRHLLPSIRILLLLIMKPPCIHSAPSDHEAPLYTFCSFWSWSPPCIHFAPSDHEVPLYTFCSFWSWSSPVYNLLHSHPWPVDFTGYMLFWIWKS